MEFLKDLVVWLLCLSLAIGIWGLITNSLTSRKRNHLIDSLALSGDYSLACAEYNRVTYYEHNWRIFTLRSARCLYGPLLQGVWNYSSNNVISYNNYWWRCYREIYLHFPLHGRAITIIRKGLARGIPLPAALILANINIEELLGDDCKNEVAPPEKYAMTGGAEEYDQIIIAQQLMGEL